MKCQAGEPWKQEGMLIPKSRSTPVSAGMCSLEPLPGWGQETPTVLCSPVHEIWQSQSQHSLPGKAGGEGPGIFSIFLGTDWFKFVSQ